MTQLIDLDNLRRALADAEALHALSRAPALARHCAELRDVLAKYEAHAKAKAIECELPRDWAQNLARQIIDHTDHALAPCNLDELTELAEELTDWSLYARGVELNKPNNCPRGVFEAGEADALQFEAAADAVRVYAINHRAALAA